MRIATNTILRNYSANLSKSAANLEASRTKVATRRNFNKVSESPSGATKAFQLRRDFIRNEDHLENIKMAQGKFTSIETGISQVSKMAEQINADILTGINGTTSKEQREAIAQGFDKMKESMLLSMNAKDGDKFVFGGSNTTQTPLKMGADNELFYFVKMDETDPTKAIYVNVRTGMGEDGNPIKDKDGNDIDGETLLKNLANEKLYMDTGFGLQLDDGKVVDGTALNTSYPAIDLISFGQTKEGHEGHPKNLISIVGKLADEFGKDTMDSEKVNEMVQSFTEARNNIIDKMTSVGTMSNFLEITEERLIDNRINLNTKIVDIENVDMEQAITEFEFAKYAYSAALKVGTSILQPSFIDFMR